MYGQCTGAVVRGSTMPTTSQIEEGPELRQLYRKYLDLQSTKHNGPITLSASVKAMVLGTLEVQATHSHCQWPEDRSQAPRQGGFQERRFVGSLYLFTVYHIPHTIYHRPHAIYFIPYAIGSTLLHTPL